MESRPHIGFLLVIAVVLALGASLAQATIPPAERQALIDLYTGTNGVDWNYNDGWLGPPGTECSWWGVTCDYDEINVTEIDLNYNHLVGTLPASIGDLVYLRSLHLVGCNDWWCHNDNDFTGSIPEEIGNLFYLEELVLSFNRFSDSIPRQIGNLVNLRIFELRANSLTGSIPPLIKNLRKMEILDLSYNRLSSPIPSGIGDLTKLEILDLSFNDLSGPIPPEIGHLSALRFLILVGNPLGAFPPEIGNLSVLQNLDLSQCELTGSIPPEIGNLTNLWRLNLYGNHLTGSIPPELGNLVNLELLYLWYNQLSGSIPPELGNLSSLEWLCLSHNQLSGPIPPEFGYLSSLMIAFLQDNQLESIPSEIGNLSSVRTLDLSYNELSGPIPPEIGNLSTLSSLYLESNHLSGPIPPEIGNLSTLSSLWLESNRLSGSIPTEICDLPDLRYLGLDSNKLAGEIPTTLASRDSLFGGISYNGLYTSDPALQAFLDEEFGPEWIDTQTLAPENIAVTAVGDHTVWLGWDPVTYADVGGYEVFVAPAGTGLWTSIGWTATKDTTVFPATGLDPGASYDVAVASFTNPHASNQNLVLSDASSPVMTTTANGGCAEPTIVIGGGSAGVTLSLEGAYDAYLWGTGETTPTVEVPLETSQWYWVTVNSAGSCEETATVLVGPEAALLFADGFEEGDTSAWSRTLE